MMKFLAIILILSLNYIHAQNLHFLDNGDVINSIQSNLDSVGNNFHTTIKPYYQKEVYRVVQTDSVYKQKYVTRNSWFYRKLTAENFVRINKKNFEINIDPAFNFTPTHDLLYGKNYLEFSSGLAIQGRIGNNFSFYGEYLYNKSSFLPYIQSFIQKNGIIPGQGLANIETWGYIYRNYSLYVAYDVSKHITLEAGKGKNFWGDGYRSLFLSDNAYSYPYFKITTNIWKIKYVNLYAAFDDISNNLADPTKPVQKKYGTFHYLSWNIGTRLNIGLYEAMIWAAKDSIRNKGFDPYYLNPIIFYRPMDLSLGSPANAFLGLNLKYKLAKKQVLYSQILLDDFNMPYIKDDIKHLLHPSDNSINWGAWASKQAFQIGLKSYDLLKVENFDFQTEFNYIRPYTYSHRWVIDNFGHFNQSLTDPLNANCWEYLAIFKYSYYRWFVECRFSYAIVGLDTTGTEVGQNIYKAAWDANEGNNTVITKVFHNNVGQGIRTNILWGQVRCSYLVNYKNNLCVDFGFAERKERTANSIKEARYFTFGIRCGISKRNYDF